MRVAVGIFIAFHGLVHAMYAGQALRWFELRPGFTWPTGARLMPSGMSDDSLRSFTAVTICLAAAAIVTGGIGIALDAGWADWVTIGGAVGATLLHLLLWNGDWKTFSDQGLYGIVINAGIVAGVLIAR